MDSSIGAELKKRNLLGDEKFRYMMLSRMQSDCKYYLGNGGRFAGHLWAGNEVEQIACMKALWKSFGEGEKPEWLSYDDILAFEKEMCPKAILVEMDYKGSYGRFALTEEEFAKEYPETYKGFGPFAEVDNIDPYVSHTCSLSESDTLRPMVHIWFCPTSIGSDFWNTFFTDMEWGLPESDIDCDNVAYIDLNEVQSLKKYVEPYDERPALEEQIESAVNREKEPQEAVDEKNKETGLDR